MWSLKSRAIEVLSTVTTCIAGGSFHLARRRNQKRPILPFITGLMDCHQLRHPCFRSFIKAVLDILQILTILGILDILRIPKVLSIMRILMILGIPKSPSILKSLKTLNRNTLSLSQHWWEAGRIPRTMCEAMTYHLGASRLMFVCVFSWLSPPTLKMYL